MEQYVWVVRHKGDWKKGKVKLSDVKNLRWDDISGGIRKYTGTCELYGYIWCNQIIEGEIGHSGIHGPCPHNIKVLIQKCDNDNGIYNDLAAEADKNSKKFSDNSERIGAADIIREIVREQQGILATEVAKILEKDFTKEDVQKTIRYLKKNEFKEKDGLRSEKCGITQKLYIKEKGTN